MPTATMPSKDALQRLLDGLQMFIREHLALARSEMKADLRAMGRDLAVCVAGVPALVAGYLLLMMATGYLLSVWLPQWAGFGIVALLNLGAGGSLTLAGMRRVRGERVELPRIAEELRRDREWLAALKQGAFAQAGAVAGSPRPVLSNPGQPAEAAAR
jgi:hypothetical protein